MAVRGSWDLLEMPVHLSAFVRTRQQDRATVLGGVQGQTAQGENLALALRMQLQVQLLKGSAHTFSVDGSCVPTLLVIVPTTTEVSPPARKLPLSDHLGKAQRQLVGGATHEQIPSSALLG